MKRLAALLLLVLPWPALALQCPDGYSLASSLENCPAYITPYSPIDVGATSATITGIGDAQAATATHYVYVSTTPYPPGCTAGHYTHADLSSLDPQVVATAVRAKQACTRHDLIRSGVGASVAVTPQYVYVAGQFWSVVTGLTAGTAYYAHYELVGGPRRGAISLVQTSQLTTSADSGGGPPTPPDPGYQPVNDAGQERYVGTGGSNLNDGLSHANRKLTLAATINCGLPAGTNVALLNTSTFAGQRLLICHGGTASDWNIIGSYKLDGSSVPVWTLDNTWGPNTTDTKAKITGTITQTSINARSTNYSLAAYASAGLGNDYGAYLEVYDTADYTEVRNIRLENVLGNVLYVRGNETQGSLHHVIIDGVDGYNVASGFGAMQGGVQDAVLRNSTLQMWATCYQERNLGNPSYETCGYGGVPAFFVTARSINARTLFEGNWVEDGIGEMFDFGIRSSYGIAAENFGSNVSSYCGYADAGQWYVFERNVCQGDQNGNYGIIGSSNSGQGLGLSGALGVDIENFQGSTAFESINNLYRNNLLVNVGTGVNFGMGTAPYTGGKRIGGWVVGNTIVKAGQEIKLWPPVNVDQIQIKMNLFWNTSASTCDLTSQVDTSHNHSYAAWSDPDCADVTNTTGDPQLALSNYTTWGNSDHANPRAFTDAIPGAGSPVINAGTALTTTVLDHTAYGFALDQRRTVRLGLITKENWAKLLYEDAAGNVRGCSGNPDPGAMERC